MKFEVVVISEHSMDNVVLFPKTLDYYEQELTRYLQTEQYGEAQRLLSYLIQFPNVNARQSEQWEALLQWLQTIQPESGFPSAPLPSEDEENEEELLRQLVADRTSLHAEYPDKLLSMLHQGTMEQQLIALEQLAYIEQSGVSDSLRSWLSGGVQHPHLQFKALQCLKLRGDKGIVAIPRAVETVVVEIEETPLSPDQYPVIIRDMIRRVAEISESDSPDFHYFAEQTWNEFLAFTYGTSLYKEMLKQDEGAVDIWASALHTVLQEILFGQSDRAGLIEQYGITEAMLIPWKQAYQAIHRLSEDLFPPLE